MTDINSDILEQRQPTAAVENPFNADTFPRLSATAIEPATSAGADEPLPQPGLFLGMTLACAYPLSQVFIALPVLLIVSVFVAAEDKAGRLTGMLAGSQGSVLLLALLAGAACTWLAKHRAFSLAPIRFLHMFAIMGLVLPATMVSRAFYDIAFMGWSQITAALPGLKFMDEMNTMSQIGDIVSNVPFPVMLFAMAVVPAIAEEVVFRGIIGRGLTARYGMISGIAMTSILFGMAHVHPAHAVSVIPLGIVMHVLYVATRSLWAPILFHFYNNAFAVFGATLAFKSGQNLDMNDSPGLPWWVVLAGIGSVSAWFYLLSLTRTKLVTEDGVEWSPGYESTETPRHVPTQRVHTKMPVGATLAAVICGGIFFVALVAFAAAGLEQVDQEAMIQLLP